MRVTHVITRLIVGGAQENTIASVLGLRAKPGMEVKLISGPTTGPEGSLEARLAHSHSHSYSRSHSVSLEVEASESRSKSESENSASKRETPLLTILPELVRPIHPWKDIRAIQKLTREFQARRPDVVHTHSGKAGVLGRLAARRAGVPLVVHTIHGPSFGPFQGTLANLVFRGAERRAAHATDHFVVVADAMKEQYLAAGIGRPEQYTKIFSGFELAPFHAAKNDPHLRARLGFAPDDCVVGKIARLFKLKGHDDLFAAASELVRRCPRMKFLLVGDGAWRAKFEARARALGLEKHFVFTGLVRPEDVPPLIGVMDIVVHLSRREGLARALPQSLAAARPVVAYDCDGAGEVCGDGETGFLVSPGDTRALTERLLTLAGDAALRENLGRRGQAFVREHFSVQRMVDELHALYLRLAHGRGGTATHAS